MPSTTHPNAHRGPSVLAATVYDIEDDNISISSDDTIGDNSFSVNSVNRENLRNASLASSLTYAVTRSGIRVRTGDTVELESDHRDTERINQCEFLRIKYIYEDDHKRVLLQGWKFRRSSRMRGITVPENLDEINEVTMLINQDLDDERDPLTQGMETFPLEKVVRNRKLVLTNKAFPAHSFQEHSNASELCCRWIAIFIFENTSGRKKFYRDLAKEMAAGKTKVSKQGVIRRVREFEADPECAALDRMLLLQWLGYFPWQKDRTGNYRASRRAAADICCGAGFASLGLRQAGFKVSWSVDKEESAMRTYTLNHPGTNGYCLDIGDFYHVLYFDEHDEHHVEILHCSFPCPYFSPAHTRPGRNDEANTAPLFALRELLSRIKPRIITFENTGGLQSHWAEWLQAALRMCTEVGYSVTWKIVKLIEYGLAHTRARLIIIASCPGSVLPHFPEPTHGPKGYYPYNTIRKALAPLGHAAHPIPNHDPSRMTRYNKPPYNDDTQLRHTIMTNGTDIFHPSGRRKFSIRELVLLQGAPLNYKFAPGLTETDMRKQCGNAFPTEPACAIFTSVYLALDAEDSEMEAVEDIGLRS